MAATKALRKGDWKKCEEHVMRVKALDLVPKSAVIKQSVSVKIKEAALKIYVSTYGSQYVSLSLASLVELFEISERDAFRTVSQLMSSDQLQGAVD